MLLFFSTKFAKFNLREGAVGVPYVLEICKNVFLNCSRSSICSRDLQKRIFKFRIRHRGRVNYIRMDPQRLRRRLWFTTKTCHQIEAQELMIPEHLRTWTLDYTRAAQKSQSFVDMRMPPDTKLIKITSYLSFLDKAGRWTSIRMLNCWRLATRVESKISTPQPLQ